MGLLSKQIAIYISLLLVCSTFTLISPFYPAIARSKGIPLWLIGIFMSLNPLANLITSMILGKYMVLIGRKIVILGSFIATALSMFILSPIEECDSSTVIILTIIARILGGIGAGCVFMSVATVFISDYPDDIQIMLGRMEAAIGLGFILGPLIGSALYLINLAFALIVVGALILLFSPIAWKMLGTFKDYEVNNITINRTKLFLKPVIFI